MVIVHPEYAFLILEVNDLKDQIANLIVESDTLIFYTCKDLKIDYMLKIGALEYKFIVAENNYLKNLKKLEIIEEKISKNQKINLESIEKKINLQFKKENKAEKSMLKSIDFAIEASSLKSIDYDMLEQMNIDYFKLQKLYNPIFDYIDDEKKNKMHKKVEKYYENGNYEKMHKMAENYDPEYVFQDEFSNLKKIKDYYIEIIKKYKNAIRKIKNSFPYNQKVILENETLYRRKKDRINKKISEVNIENKKIEKKIQSKLLQ